ncbi:MAG: PEGA domain-containing protein [Deltaproteobacteria bacterium]|nr:MAG: PEGA domain-containing protein [Deltaproteobacteria bacterium]
MKKIISVIVISILMTGCATIIHGRKQNVLISSQPSDSQVIVDGTSQGKTPVKVDLKRKEGHFVTISHEGYQPQEIRLERKVSGWVWGNIGFGGLIGLGVDAGTGSMYKLKPGEVSVQLQKLSGTSTVSTTSPETASNTTPATLSLKDEVKTTEGKVVSLRNKLLQTQSVYVVRYQAGDHPALNIAKSFLEKMENDKSLGNYQILDYVYQSDDLNYLKSGFSQGYVFDFKNIKGDKVRARLIQFPERKVVWEEVCENSNPDACSQNLFEKY